jgi:hypothetical protein
MWTIYKWETDVGVGESRQFGFWKELLIISFRSPPELVQGL